MNTSGQLPAPGTEVAVVLTVDGQLREMGAQFQYLWVDDHNVPVALSVSGWNTDESGAEKQVMTLFSWANVTSMTWALDSNKADDDLKDSEPEPKHKPAPEPIPRAHTHGRVFGRPQTSATGDEEIEVAAEAFRGLISSVAASVISGAGSTALNDALSEFKKQAKRAGQVGN